MGLSFSISRDNGYIETNLIINNQISCIVATNPLGYTKSLSVYSNTTLESDFRQVTFVIPLSEI